MLDQGFVLDRNTLAQVFRDPRTLLAFEALLKLANIETPAAVNEALAEAAQAILDAAAAQVTADQAISDAAAADAAANAAQADANSLKAPEYVTMTAAAILGNERVLTPTASVTLDTGTAGQVKIVVDVELALGYTPADAALFVSGATVVASLGTATLGKRWMVTDATQTLTAGIGAVVAGGGANTVPVVADGAAWLIG